jgi:hypothetical protein
LILKQDLLYLHTNKEEFLNLVDASAMFDKSSLSNLIDQYYDLIETLTLKIDITDSLLHVSYSLSLPILFCFEVVNIWMTQLQSEFNLGPRESFKELVQATQSLLLHRDQQYVANFNLSRGYLL